MDDSIEDTALWFSSDLMESMVVQYFDRDTEISKVINIIEYKI